MYKWSQCRRVSQVLGAGYAFKQGDYAANLRNHRQMHDEICEVVREDSDLRTLLDSQLTPDCHPDPQMKTLTGDIAFHISEMSEHQDPDDASNDEGEGGAPSNVLTPTDTLDTTSHTNHTSDAPEPNYWWLVASPKQTFRFADLDVGDTVEWALRNPNGKLRQVHQNFRDAREGDLVIGYESHPIQQIVALGTIAREQDGEALLFRKTEGLVSPVDYATIRTDPGLADMQAFSTNMRGSLFRLTKDEYDAIIDLVRDANPLTPDVPRTPYAKEDFLSEVYMPESDYDRLVRVLRRKRNIILQGAPGVGKTFAANRLAWSMMGEVDPNRVEFVQFHQNYSYEDFVMGYRPSGSGFTLRRGVFHDFCARAANHPDREFFFIIDEINRGNLSKIFGELLMLIENEYRGTKMTLAYDGSPSSVPPNVLVIGMMNTADRSLAMIDYALRRRFSFITMEPGFDTEGFTKYQADLDDGTLDNLIRAVKELNTQITKDPSLGAGFCIGHSYFCAQHDVSPDWLRAVVDYDVLPMLEEYWFDDPNKVDEWRTRFHEVLQS